MTSKPASEDRHPLHSLCSYIGCFPPRVPARIIEALCPSRTTVLDPFCGSGTTLVEARLRGHRVIGVDLNPLGVAVTAGKLAQVNEHDVLTRVTELAKGFSLARSFSPTADEGDVPDDLRTIFHPRALMQLCYLRQALDRSRSEDIFLEAAVLGIMHGKFRRNKTTAYLSIDMPNTFSMSPEYVRGFVKKHKLTQPPSDVFKKLAERTSWLLRRGPLPGRAPTVVVQGDATRLDELLPKEERSVGAIVTSPPYLGVLRYGAFNWIRLWFLGHDPFSVDRMLDGTDSLDRYLGFMVSFLQSAASVLPVGAPVALVIGDVEECGQYVPLATRVWDELGGVVPFELESIRIDRFDTTTKTTRIWGEEKRGRATPQDRVLVLRRIRSVRRRSIPPARRAVG